MTAAGKWDLVSEEDYLEGELISDQKHEYLAGVVYAMAGARNRHNDIGMNCSGELRARLRGKPCKPCNSDTKVRIRLATGTRYYYPDTMVVCRPNPDDDSFQDEPAVIIEVLSESTRRTDEGEKKDAYLMIPSLGVYLMVEQTKPVARPLRRPPLQNRSARTSRRYRRSRSERPPPGVEPIGLRQGKSGSSLAGWK